MLQSGIAGNKKHRQSYCFNRYCQFALHTTLLSLSKDRINSFSIALPTTSWIFANLIGKKFYLSVVSFAFHFLCKRMNDLTLVKDSFVFPFSKYPSTFISFAYFSIGLLAWISCLFLETIYTEGGQPIAHHMQIQQTIYFYILNADIVSSL